MKEVLRILRTTLPADPIATALQLTRGEADDLFTDGRAVSWFAELWASHIYRFQRRASRQAPVNGRVPAKVPHDVRVRAMVRHIRFQESGDQGKGRDCDQAALIAALERIETVVVVDVRAWPTVNFVPVDSKALLRLVREGGLTPKGLSAKQFDAWLARAFHVVIEEIPVERLRAQEAA